MVKSEAQLIREMGDRLSALYDEPAVAEDEGKTVKHFFKHYDVQGQGTLTQPQFA